MFRRPTKNPLEDNSPLYQEEQSSRAPSYVYGPRNTHSIEGQQRIFDPASIVTPREEEDKTSSVPHHFQAMMKEEEPETTLGEGVSFRGELSFERLLRIDGSFEGELLSQGKVIVGPRGKVKANLHLREAIIEGEVIGNIEVQEKLELRAEAKVIGDITAKSLTVDEGVQITGHVHVTFEPLPEKAED